jgi:type I pantothenate kinase
MVNLPNLVDHIEPTRARADVVVRKGPDHAIREVRWAAS